MCTQGSRLVWLRRDHRPEPVSMLVRALVPFVPSLDSKANRVHPSFAAGPPQSSFALGPARSLSKTSTPPRGSSPPRGITLARPPHEGSPPSATFRSQAFSASQRFSPRPGFAGLFHPTTTSRVSSSSGACPLHAARSFVSEERCPHAVAASFTHHPRAVAVTERLDFEALIHAKIRSVGLV